MTLTNKLMMMDNNDTSSANKKKQPYGLSLVGKTVLTTYGKGIVLGCREEDQYVYEIKLTKQGADADYSPLAILYTRELPTRIKTPQEEAEELNIAYEAQEKMRRMNLEMECFEHGITSVQHDQCTVCLLEPNRSTDGSTQNRFPRLQKFVDTARDTAESASAAAVASTDNSNRFPRLRNLWGAAAPSTKEQEEKNYNEADKKPAAKTSSQRVVLPRIQKLLDDRQKASAAPCLICGNHICQSHASSNFRKEGITLCLGCERLFELDFIIECVSTPDAAERAKRIDHMVDCYDRCQLLLKYSTQYVEQIAQSLEQQKEKQNRIGLGSSGAGVMSGVLGIAAAASILTPAGPPLLIASLFFGGGATAVQTGSEAYNYFSEPNKLADRIIALHGMILSILRVTSTLRDAMMRDHIRTDVFEAEKTSLSDAVQEKLEKNKAGVLAASNVGRAATLGSVAGVEAGAVATASTVATAEVAAGAGARGATIVSRAGTAAARTVRFARFAGGALSAAVLVMEANAIHSTLKEIHKGSPCEKAGYIRAIAEEIRNEDLPTTSELDEECQAYLVVLANRTLPPPEVAAVEATGTVIQDYPEAECATMVPLSAGNGDVGDSFYQSTGALITSGEEASVAAIATPAATAFAPQNESSFLSSAGSSLLQRIKFQHQRAGRGDSIPARSDDIFAGGATVEDTQQAPRESELNLVL
jgi:hypothetical protein